MSISDLREFPYITYKHELRCHHCSSRKMWGHKDSGFSAGRGEFVARCDECKRLTWYDAPDRHHDEVSKAWRD